MTMTYKLSLTLLAGVAIGVIAGTAIHAQQTKPPPGYLVAEVEVTDPAGFQKYVQGLPATYGGYNVRTVIRGKPQPLEGDAPKNFVLLAFDSAEQAHSWYDSPAYQAIKPLRLNAAKSTVYIVEGLPPQ